MLQLVLWNLLLPDPHRECYSTFQCMAEGEETLQVVVLVGRRQGLLEREAGRAKATEERRRRRKQMYCDRVGTCFRANATTTWTLVVCMCVLMYRQGEPKRHSLCCLFSSGGIQPSLTCVCTDDTAWISRLKSPLWPSIHLTGGTWRGSFYKTQEI